MKNSGTKFFIITLVSLFTFICLIIMILWMAMHRDHNGLEDLDRIARNKAFQCLAESWVDKNIPNGNISDLEGKVSSWSGMAPSSEHVDIDFPWDDVGFMDHSTVSVLLGAGGVVNAVLFQEVSRIGIYVKPIKNIETHFDPKRYKSVSARVGVFYIGDKGFNEISDTATTE